MWDEDLKEEENRKTKASMLNYITARIMKILEAKAITGDKEEKRVLPYLHFRGSRIYYFKAYRVLLDSVRNLIV